MDRAAKGMIKRTNGMLSEAQSYFTNMLEAIRRMKRRERKLEKKDIGLSQIVEDYSAK